MSELPIILHDAQVQTIANGRRSHIFKPARYQPGGRYAIGEEAKAKARNTSGNLPMYTPAASIAVADRLWVQEAVCSVSEVGRFHNRLEYFRADLIGGVAPLPAGARPGRFKRALVDARHMTRAQSRWILTVTDVRICKVQDVSWDEIRDEGANFYPSDSKPQWWARYYGIILPWDENPEVVSISFLASYENIDGLELPPRKTGRAVGAAALLAAWDGKK